MRILRAVVQGLLATICSFLAFVGAASGMLVDPVRGRAGHYVAKLWARSMLAIAGARLTVVGADRLVPSEPRVLVANHASYLDIPAMMVMFPGQLRMVARKNLAMIPFVGWFIAVGGHFLIDRDDPRQALRLMGKMAERMKRRHLSALFFPEGTRTTDGLLQPLKSGAFFLPLALGVPVQPIAIFGTREIFPKGRFFPLRRGPVEVRIGEPIPGTVAEGSAARRDLAERTRAAFVALGVPAGAPSDGAPTA
jgi:1-acyl-sn-glycerol-3-phosphate acyltransferase